MIIHKIISLDELALEGLSQPIPDEELECNYTECKARTRFKRCYDKRYNLCPIYHDFKCEGK